MYNSEKACIKLSCLLLAKNHIIFQLLVDTVFFLLYREVINWFALRENR